MGQSRLIPFTIEMRCSDGKYYTPGEWHVRQRRGMPKHHVDGTPSTENIDKWVTAFEESRKTGGCNAHLGFAVVLEAMIKNQKKGGEVVARWVRKTARPDEPLFQVID
jgi:hypothetical protein